MKTIENLYNYFNTECKNDNFRNVRGLKRFAMFFFNRTAHKIAEKYNGGHMGYERYTENTQGIDMLPSQIRVSIDYKKVCRKSEKFFAELTEAIAAIDDTLKVETSKTLDPYGNDFGIQITVSNWNDEVIERLCNEYWPMESVEPQTVAEPQTETVEPDTVAESLTEIVETECTDLFDFFVSSRKNAETKSKKAKTVKSKPQTEAVESTPVETVETVKTETAPSTECNTNELAVLLDYMENDIRKRIIPYVERNVEKFGLQKQSMSIYIQHVVNARATKAMLDGDVFAPLRDFSTNTTDGAMELMTRYESLTAELNSFIESECFKTMSEFCFS